MKSIGFSMANKALVRICLPADEVERARLVAGLSIYGRPSVTEGAVHANVPTQTAAFLLKAYQAEILDDRIEDDRDEPWDPPSEGGFHSYESLLSDADKLVSCSQGTVTRECLGTTYEKREIVALRLKPEKSSKKRVLLMGAHHARERISVEIPYLLFAGFLNDRLVTHCHSFLREMEVVVIPMLNPDGHTYSTTTWWNWRKNRSPQGTEFGVDLNRNYPVGWGVGDGSADEAGYYYRGPRPLSELETQSMDRLFGAENYDALLTYHSYGQSVLFPWAGRVYSGGNSRIEDLARISKDMAALPTKSGIPYSALAASKLYGQPIGGELCDWALEKFGIDALGVELAPAENPPGFKLRAAKIKSAYDDHLPAALMFMEWVSRR
jgi:carboxypeptidase T